MSIPVTTASRSMLINRFHVFNTMDWLERYFRQLHIVNQDRLSRSRVLVVGVGGLGNIVATELALAGVGIIHLVDPDAIEVHNLNRQFLYRDADVGKPKADVAARRLAEMNPYISIRGFVGHWEDLDLSDYDIVVDCMDIWREKVALSRACSCTLVTGSVGEDLGLVSVLVSKTLPAAPIRSVAGGSMLGARVAAVGAFMANEVLRELSGQPSPLRDRLLHIDFGRMMFTTLGL